MSVAFVIGVAIFYGKFVHLERRKYSVDVMFVVANGIAKSKDSYC